MMFKKYVSAALCLLMLAVLLVPCGTVMAAPAEKTTFTLSVTEGAVGDTVTVSVLLSENSYFSNATFYIHYDVSKVAFVEDSLDVGSASPSGKAMFDVLDHPDKQYVKGAYVTVSGIKKAGELIKMDFEVLDAAPAAFSMSFEECVGVDENDVEFDVSYDIVGCVLNNDGSVQVPTGGPGVTTTTSVPATTTTASSPLVTEGEEYYESTNATTMPTMSTMPTMIVTDEGNNKITIPVVTTTDASGNSATVPVAVVTDAKGTTVTVPVVIVTDTAGSVATIPVATGTDAQGNNVTIPVAIITDEEGNVETVPVATATDAKGSIVTIPVTTSTTAPAAENSGLTTGIVIVVICVIVAVIVAFAAMKLRKKSENE